MTFTPFSLGPMRIPRSALAGIVLLTTALPGLRAQESGSGRIAGQVVDAQTGRPLQDVHVEVAGRFSVATDLDGR